MPLSPQVQERLEREQFLWLTTQTSEGRPWSVPVWFVLDEGEIQVFSSPAAKKVGNLERNPLASVHTNLDPEGHGFVELKVECRSLSRGVDPAALPAYVEKYREAIEAFGVPLEEYQNLFSVGIWFGVTGEWVDG